MKKGDTLKAKTGKEPIFLTQLEIEKISGVSQATLSGIFNGKYPVSAKVAKLLARALKLPEETWTLPHKFKANHYMQNALKIKRARERRIKQEAKRG
jgi:transcriptional regulator with XRE-family HTH domain